jgi:hypothetical protein
MTGRLYGIAQRDSQGWGGRQLREQRGLERVVHIGLA